MPAARGSHPRNAHQPHTLVVFHAELLHQHLPQEAQLQARSGLRHPVLSPGPASRVVKGGIDAAGLPGWDALSKSFVLKFISFAAAHAVQVEHPGDQDESLQQAA